jgi:hypothetical protein
MSNFQPPEVWDDTFLLTHPACDILLWLRFRKCHVPWNIWAILILKRMCFIWNSNSNEHPVYYLTILTQELPNLNCTHFLGSRNKVPQTGWLKQKNTLSQVWRLKSLRPRSALLFLLRENLFHASPNFWRFTGNLWGSMAYRNSPQSLFSWLEVFTLCVCPCV